MGWQECTPWTSRTGLTLLAPATTWSRAVDAIGLEARTRLVLTRERRPSGPTRRERHLWPMANQRGRIAPSITGSSVSHAPRTHTNATPVAPGWKGAFSQKVRLGRATA
jgi:hypothetical protein